MIIIKNTYSDINQKDKNQIYFDFNKMHTYDKNLEQDINSGKKDTKIINKFRISHINKEENHLEKEDEKKIVLTNKFLENKIINEEQDDFNFKNQKSKRITINYDLSTN